MAFPPSGLFALSRFPATFCVVQFLGNKASRYSTEKPRRPIRLVPSSGWSRLDFVAIMFVWPAWGAALLFGASFLMSLGTVVAPAFVSTECLQVRSRNQTINAVAVGRMSLCVERVTPFCCIQFLVVITHAAFTFTLYVSKYIFGSRKARRGTTRLH